MEFEWCLFSYITLHSIPFKLLLHSSPSLSRKECFYFLIRLLTITSQAKSSQPKAYRANWSYWAWERKYKARTCEGCVALLIEGGSVVLLINYIRTITTPHSGAECLLTLLLESSVKRFEASLTIPAHHITVWHLQKNKQITKFKQLNLFYFHPNGNLCRQSWLR